MPKELQTLRTELKSANTALTDSKEELNRLRNQYDKISTENKKLLGAKRQDITLKQQLQDSGKKITELQHQLDKVQGQKKSATLKVSRTQKELKECQAELANQKTEFDQAFANLKAEQGPQSPKREAILRFPSEPFWLVHQKVVRLADGFVLLMYDYSASPDILILTVGTQQDRLKIYGHGKRFDFSYGNQKYFIDVLEKEHRRILVTVISAK
jgi:seryl-tRNA synthetase